MDSRFLFYFSLMYQWPGWKYILFILWFDWALSSFIEVKGLNLSYVSIGEFQNMWLLIHMWLPYHRVYKRFFHSKGKNKKEPWYVIAIIVNFNCINFPFLCKNHSQNIKSKHKYFVILYWMWSISFHFQNLKLQNGGRKWNSTKKSCLSG